MSWAGFVRQVLATAIWTAATCIPAYGQESGTEERCPSGGTVEFAFWDARSGGDTANIDPEAEDLLVDSQTAAEAIALFLFFRDYQTSHPGQRIADRYESAGRRAVALLEQRLSASPCDRIAWQQLVLVHLLLDRPDALSRTASHFESRYPDDHRAPLARAYSNYLAGRPEEAWADVERVVGLVPDDRKADFLGLAPILAAEDHADYRSDPWPYTLRFFARHDPIHLTEVNERIVSHFARLAYADIVYPRWRESADDEWSLTPGDLILRYGTPLAQRVVTLEEPSYERQNTLVFTGRTFTFTDALRNGEYYLRRRQLINARDSIRASPHDHALRNLRTFELAASAYCFETPDAGAIPDLYVSLGVPIQSNSQYEASAVYETGAFLGDSLGGSLPAFRSSVYGLAFSSLSDHAGHTFWSQTRQVKLRSSDYDHVRVEFLARSEGQFGMGEVSLDECAPRDPNRIGLGSLILASLLDEQDPGAPSAAPVARNGREIWPLPPGAAVRIGDPLYLYTEVYRAQGLRLEFSVAVSSNEDRGLMDRLFRNRRDAAGISVSSELIPVTAWEGIDLRLDLTELPPGDYMVTLAVRTPEGIIEQASRAISLR